MITSAYFNGEDFPEQKLAVLENEQDCSQKIDLKQFNPR
jgi:hypothetical protein